MDWLLKRGERGIILGQTGSGKTVGAMHHLRESPLSPVLVFDTKIEPSFENLPLSDESMELIESGDDFLKQWKQRKQPDYLLIRPSMAEVANPELLDDLLLQFYSMGRGALLYIDEAYQWHVAGRAGAGLTGILTRGRSKGMSTLLSSQRPAWVSRFCFTEVQKYYIFLLSDKRDHQTVANYVPGFDLCQRPVKYHSWFYHAGETESPLYCKPVNFMVGSKSAVQETGRNRSRNWI